MITYTHGILGYLLYLKGTKKQRILAVWGAVTPDIFLSIGFLFHYLESSSIVNFFHELFHYSFLHTITEYMHSILVGLILLGLSYILLKKFIPFFVGMLSHAFLDLLTHQSSLYNHFLPLPLPMFAGPLSYTNLWFTLLEHLVVLGFFIWFFTRKKIDYNKYYTKIKKKVSVLIKQ